MACKGESALRRVLLLLVEMGGETTVPVLGGDGDGVSPISKDANDFPGSSTGIFFLRPLLARGCGLVWILRCLVSSSLRLNRFAQPGKSQACGFSPVWVLKCLVWCSNRRNARWHIGHTCGLGASLPEFLVFLGSVLAVATWLASSAIRFKAVAQ